MFVSFKLCNFKQGISPQDRATAPAPSLAGTPLRKGEFATVSRNSSPRSRDEVENPTLLQFSHFRSPLFALLAEIPSL